MITRRSALLSTAGLSFRASAERQRATLGAQAYVWEQFYNRKKQNPDDHIEEILTSMKRSGFRSIEARAVFFRAEKAAERAALLKRLGLRVPLMYHGMPMHTEQAARNSVDFLASDCARLRREFGLEGLVFNPDPKPKREPKTAAELDTQAKAVNSLAAALDKAGVRLLLHQHAPEMAEGARELRHLLAQTDPERVGICLDTHWVLRGGQNVMQILEECAPRLGALHLRNSVNGIWSEELSDGDIDYRAVAGFLKARDFSGHLIVELAWEKGQPETRPLEESLKRSRVYAERIFGVKA